MRIKLYIGLITILSYNSLNAQFIDNKLDVKIIYGVTMSPGDNAINEKNFIMPSLFKGYKNIIYYSIEGVYNYRSNYDLGLTWNHFNFTNWINTDSEIFSNSSSNISCFGPLIKFHTRFKQSGIFNKVELYSTLSPNISIIRSSLYQQPLFSTKPIVESGQIVESIYSTFGTRISAGAKYSISQSIDINLDISGNYFKLKSQFYNDKSLFLLNLGAGIVIKFIRNKRYYL